MQEIRIFSRRLSKIFRIFFVPAGIPLFNFAEIHV